MAATEQVILVDNNDHAIGTAEKLEAHRQGLCHRAFSIFVMRFETEWEVLLQQRAKEKYHSPNLWTNTCCSHPRPGETMIQAAERRLKEEMGLFLHLKPVGKFHYIAHFDNGLIENEWDHVLVGQWAGEEISPHPAEIQAYRWMSVTELKHEINRRPEDFTPWLRRALEIAIF
jgi:isopentenyl-diphosphate delta-isomerase type 1